MGLGKSFGISFLIYIVLNFVMNVLYQVAAGTIDTFFALASANIWSFLGSLFYFTPLFIHSPGELLVLGTSAAYALFSTDIFLALMLILGPIVPGLIASIIAGKAAKSSTQGFMGWFLTGLISIVLVYVLTLIAGTSFAVDVLVVYLLYGVATGLFWSGIAASLGKEG